jgi:hypothetical protein
MQVELTNAEWQAVLRMREREKRVLVTTGSQLVQVLRESSGREIHEGVGGGYFITEGGGSVALSAIEAAMQSGALLLRNTGARAFWTLSDQAR